MIHEFSTSKGLKVIGIESHKSPVVSVQIWTRNGSADERAQEEGLSHFIEHLVFKGTARYRAGEIAARVEGCGGEINAYTSFDQTVYYITISKHFADEAMKIIADMVTTPLFDSLEVDREREVVIEEIKRSHDSLGRRASRLFFSQMYEGHPYAVPVIGYEQNVREVSVEKLRAFFAERYVPENMFLIVTGDFNASDFQQKVGTIFGDQKPLKVQKPKRDAWAFAKGKRVVVEEAPFEETILYIGWPGVSINHEDMAALECFFLILGQGGSSRLYRKLRLQENCVNSIGAGLWAPTQSPGFLSVTASLNGEKLATTLSLISEQISEILEKGVTEEELQKAKTNFLAEEAYTIETVGGLARKYGGNYEATNDLYFHEKFQEKMEKVNTAAVLAVAREYLQNKNYVMSAVVPKDKTAVQKMLETWDFRLPQGGKETAPNKAHDYRKTKLTEAPTNAGSIQQKTLPQNIPLFYRWGDEAAIYNMRLVFLGGGRAMPLAKAGLAELAGRVWTTQTKKLSEHVLGDKTDALASSLYSFSGRNTLGLVVDGVSGYQEEMADLFLQVHNEYDFSDEIIEREKASMLESLRSRKDSPGAVASLQFQQMMFANHSYALDPLGTLESVPQLTKKDVEECLRFHQQQTQAVAAISGCFEESLWMKMLEKLQFKVTTTPMAAQPLEAFTQNQYRYTHAAKEQAHLIYGFRGLKLTDPERYTLSVLEAVLSGQGGRLFLELRDKASLAYSVSPLRMEGVDGGYFATYIGCSPEKLETALRMMKEELNKMASTTISQAELERAQNYLIGGHDIGLQKNSAISSSIAFNEIYGLTYREIYDYAKRVKAVGTEDVRKLAEKLFQQKAAMSLVGPREMTTTF